MNAIELKVPPVVLTLTVATAMWLTSTYTPSLTVTIPWRFAFVSGLAGIGIAFAVAGVIAFRQSKTTVDPRKPESTSTLVVSGVYGLSRNPMYVGFLFILSSWAVFLAHALPFVLLPVYVLYLNRFQIEPEERVLCGRFGGDYDSYRRSVRRWL